MATQIELSPGVFLDLDEGLERGDIKPEDRVNNSDEPTTEQLEAAEQKLSKEEVKEEKVVDPEKIVEPEKI